MQFKNLNDLMKVLPIIVQNAVGSTDDVRKVVANTVSEKVEEVVYDAYDPIYYNRREINGGLSDPDNVELVSIQNNGQAVQMIFENLTEGNDTLKGLFITDTIEEGIRDNWGNPNGVWSEPRPFIEESIKELQRSNDLRNAVISSLRKSGIDVK